MSEETATVADKKQEAFFKEVNVGAEINDKTQAPSEDFNAEIHCTNDDGSPRRNRDGSFRKKPVRKSVEAEVQPSPMESFANPPPPSTVHMMQMCLSIFGLLTVKTFGDEWKLSTDENAAMLDVWARYMHYKGWDMEASPEVVLIGVTASILLPRIMTPKFMARFSRKKAIPNAHVNHGANGNGKDNTGQDHRAAGGIGGAASHHSGPVVESMES